MLDRHERDTLRFYDSNGLIDDAMAAERERKLTNPWTDEEKKIFIEKYALLSLSCIRSLHARTHELTHAQVFEYRLHVLFGVCVCV